MTPEAILNWWDVFDRIGWPGILLLIIFFIGRFIWVHAPAWKKSYDKRIETDVKHNELLERINENLEEAEEAIKGCPYASN